MDTQKIGVLKELAPDTVRLITSTQVITSIVSVVKELVENSLDAGSNCIEVKLENWGLNRIEVRDNGCGMTASEVQLAALPNYTSKIETFSDLQSLNCYGFRGEALASLCSVSDVTISSKVSGDQVGTAYQLDSHGKIVSSKPVAILKGTWVTACMLFKNFPVRKQLYDTRNKKKEELRNVEITLKAFAIAVPNVRLTLVHDGMVIWKKNAMPDEKQAMLEVLDVKIMRDIVVLQEQDFLNNMHMVVYLPKKHTNIELCSRCQTDLTFVFVNKRHVRLKFVEKLLKKYFCACENIKDKYPVGCVFIGLPAQDVDVNVNPNKTEVLLSNMGIVSSMLTGILEKHYGTIDVEKQKELPEKVNSNKTTEDITVVNESEESESQGGMEIVFESVDVTNDEVEPSLAVKPNLNVQPEDSDYWSTGRLMNTSEEVIEPVHVFVPQIVIPKNKSEDCLRLKKKRKVEESDCGQKTICDLLGNDAVKRPKSSVDLFLQENDSNDNIARNNEEIEKKKLEKKATAVNSRFLATATKCYNENLQSVPTNKATRGNTASKRVKTIGVSVSLATLKQKLSLPCQSKHGIDIIGQIPNESTWICWKNANLGLLNTCDIEDAKLRDSWIRDHIVPVEELEIPVPILESDFGNNLWQTLVFMPMDVTRDRCIVTDDRLVGNGFRIEKLILNGGSFRFQISAIASCIPYYGTSDLKEILEKCRINPKADLAEIRPASVIDYIKNKVAGMEKRPSQQLSTEDISKALPCCDTECKHGKPIFVPFFNMSSTSVVSNCKQ